MKQNLLILAAFLAGFIGLNSPQSCSAQTTAFTYQGLLTELGVPASGTYDMTFTLFKALEGGSRASIIYPIDDLPITNGLFTVRLDFGASPFEGLDRWVEIAVRPGASTGDYTNLVPRQELTSAPYAIRSATASQAVTVAPGAVTSGALADGSVTAAKLAPGAVYQLSASDGSPTNALWVSTNGLIGIGTTTPRAGLEIVSSGAVLAARPLFEVEDGTSGYTNLGGVSSLAVSGNLLAVGAFYSLTIMDISAPQSPILMAQIHDGDGTFTNLNFLYGVAMKTNLLVVAAANGVTFIGLTNPASPVKLAELRDGVGGWNELSSTRAVVISGNRLAIAANDNNAVTLADISNPSAPVKRVEMKDGLFGFTNLAGARSIALSGNLLAIGAYTDNAVTLVNVADMSNPIKLAELRDGVDGYTDLRQVTSVALVGNLLAIAARADSAVTLVDVSNPASPVRLAVIKNGVAGVDVAEGPSSVAIANNQLLIGAFGAVSWWDISDPAAPHFLVAARDGVGGFNYIQVCDAVAFAGTNVAFVGENAVTLATFAAVPVGLLSPQWVGIGTDSPVAPLHVVGDVVVQSATLFDINAVRVELGANSTATGDYSTAMGYSTAIGAYSTSMGGFNMALGDYSTAMGSSTRAEGYASTAMGSNTKASGNYSTAMGYSTTALGNHSTAMGYQTRANASYCTAMGYSASALHQGSFVWADSTSSTQLVSLANDSLTMRATGGYRLFSNIAGAGVSLASGGTAWAALSDRAAKKNFQPLQATEVLSKLAAVRIERWNYLWEKDNDVPHIGPMAQDFKAAFYPGRDDKSITTLEFDGVALAAIQGLNEKVESEMKRLEGENAALKKRLERLEEILANRK